jgi:hypothetical protein
MTTFDIVINFKLAHLQIFKLTSGSSSIGRAIAFQAIGREFETRLPLIEEMTDVRRRLAVMVFTVN